MKLGGRPLVYDPTKLDVAGDVEATNLLRREYRAPWTHPNFQIHTIKSN